MNIVKIHEKIIYLCKYKTINGVRDKYLGGAKEGCRKTQKMNNEIEPDLFLVSNNNNSIQENLCLTWNLYTFVVGIIIIYF